MFRAFQAYTHRSESKQSFINGAILLAHGQPSSFTIHASEKKRKKKSQRPQALSKSISVLVRHLLGSRFSLKSRPGQGGFPQRASSTTKPRGLQAYSAPAAGASVE